MENKDVIVTVRLEDGIRLLISMNPEDLEIYGEGLRMGLSQEEALRKLTDAKIEKEKENQSNTQDEWS